MNEDRCYILCGYLNFFHLLPDFVYPIFFNEGDYFFADGDGLVIENFVKVKASYRSQIQLFPVIGPREFRAGSPQIHIYLKRDNHPLIGSGARLCEKLRGFQTGDPLLQQDLEDFLQIYGNIHTKKTGERIVRFQGTGRRKTAVARVYLTAGNGNFSVNRQELDAYLPQTVEQQKVLQPFLITGTIGQYDVYARVSGGGFSGQAEALRHGISRALLQVDTTYRPLLKHEGLLTRDPRMKERKKYGKKAARKSSQFTKR